MQTFAAPPAPPAPPAPRIFQAQIAGDAPVTSVIPVPRTAQEVRALRARREEISSQLISATERRNDLAEAIEEADGASREGLIERMQLLDRRILQLETDLELTGAAIRGASPEAVAAGQHTTSTGTTDSTPWGGLSSDQVTGISIVFTIFVLMPLAIGMARLMWKRATAPVRAAFAQDAAATQRMERMEQGIEGIAIEVERVSEAQRFLTRLLTESRDLPALGVGQRPAEPVRVPHAEALRVPARES